LELQGRAMARVVFALAALLLVAHLGEVTRRGEKRTILRVQLRLPSFRTACARKGRVRACGSRSGPSCSLTW
jgi:hypothetical protein